MDPKTLIFLVLMVGAMWFMTNRSKKQQRKAGDFRANLEVGQDVMTGSGLYGTIVDIEDDTITLESTPGNTSRWIRAAISKVIEPPVLEEEYEEDVDDVEDFADETDEVDETDEADVDFDSEDADSTLDVPDDISSLDETRKDDDTTDKK